MDFKNVMKKINRGLVLGGVLVVGLVIYIIIDHSRFKSDKPVIEQLVKDYTKEICQVVVPDAAKLNEKGELVGDTKKDKYQEIKQVITDYWVGGYEQQGIFSYNDRQNILNSLSDVYSTDNKFGCNVDSMLINLKQVDVSKSGRNSAKLKAEIEITTQTVGMTSYFEPFGMVDYGSIAGCLNDSDWNLDFPTASEKYAGKTVKSTTVLYDFEVILNKIDGEWKIAAEKDYGYSNSATIIENSEEGAE